MPGCSTKATTCTSRSPAGMGRRCSAAPGRRGWPTRWRCGDGGYCAYRAYRAGLRGCRVMAEEPNKAERMRDGTFAPGNSIGANKAGSRHRTTRAVEALLEGQAEALTQKAVALALAGDGPALRLCLDRIAPPRKDAPV